MKLRDMMVGGHYVVTKGGTTLSEGEHVFLDHDRCLVSREAEGWLVPDDWQRLRNIVEVDVEFYKKKIADLKKASKEMGKQLSRLLEHQDLVG